MKRLLNIILCGLCLNVIEYVILLTCNLTEGFSKGTVPVAIINSAFRGTNEIIAMRFIFYSVFWIAAMYFLYHKINIRNAKLKFAIINCGLYIAISLLMCIPFPGAVEFFIRDFFFFLVIATFLSPFILFTIPILKRLTNSLTGEAIVPTMPSP